MPLMTDHNVAPTEPAPADRDWFGGRRWTGILSIGVLILVAVCLIIVFAVNRGSNDNHTGAPTGTAQPTGTGQPTGATSVTATAAALPTTIPTTAPSATTWSLFETVALPTLAGAGPVKIDGPSATGYAHTPLGALLATANESYRFLLASDDTWRAAAEAMLAPSPGKTAWIATRSGISYGPGGASENSSGFAQIAGFQYVSYSPTDAVIQIVTRDTNNVYQVGTQHVSWSDGDWKYVTASDGSQLSNVQTVDSLAGFIEWRGV